jgi:hypothetical protein
VNNRDCKYLSETLFINWPFIDGYGELSLFAKRISPPYRVENSFLEKFMEASLRAWEPDTFDAFFSVMSKSPGTFIDFGSWIGVTAVYGAYLAGLGGFRGYALEPG